MTQNLGSWKDTSRETPPQGTPVIGLYKYDNGHIWFQVVELETDDGVWWEYLSGDLYWTVEPPKAWRLILESGQDQNLAS